MKVEEIRKKYLEFFQKNGHKIISSSSLIPENDPTTLFTGSGMQPMVPYLLGEKHPEGGRITDSQKCFRTQDIEEVGDNRHTTFFEMLGNWSLGDYFRKEQINWIFNFLTEEIGLDPSKIFITIFRGNESLGLPRDTESASIWQGLFGAKKIDTQIVDFAELNGMSGGRIFYYDETKNWWSRAGVPGNMPVGEPGGPDSEIFWDFGVELKLHENSTFKNLPCHINCDCGRFLEIGNNVFMTYIKTNTGFEELPNKNIDFGGGLERMAAASINSQDMFKIDVFDKLRQKIEELSGAKYEESKESLYSFRVIMDHIRAATFLIADGAVPSNKDQGYFTRRLIRRAVRYALKINLAQNFCSTIASSVVESYSDFYKYLGEKKELIKNEFEREESKFRSTLEKGLKEAAKLKEINPEIAFNLYQSFGFPLELTLEEFTVRGLIPNEPDFRNKFQQEFKKHQEKSRAGSEQKFAGGLADHSVETTKLHTTTHILHMALRKVLGERVFQKGSNITQERLRFDFSHPQKMTPEELAQVEQIANKAIEKDYPVHFEIMDVEDAKKIGAIGVFGDKYATLGNKIKVYIIGSDEKGYFSKEICGGPHVEHTGTIGKIKILKEEAVSSGVRRIKAIIQPNE